MTVRIGCREETRQAHFTMQYGAAQVPTILATNKHCLMAPYPCAAQNNVVLFLTARGCVIECNCLPGRSGEVHKQ